MRTTSHHNECRHLFHAVATLPIFNSHALGICAGLVTPTSKSFAFTCGASSRQPERPFFSQIYRKSGPIISRTSLLRWRQERKKIYCVWNWVARCVCWKVPRPSPHVWERGSSVLNNFSCHIGWGSSPIWELKSDCRNHNYHNHAINDVAFKHKI